MQVVKIVIIAGFAMFVGHWLATTRLPIWSLLAGWTLVSIPFAMLFGKAIGAMRRTTSVDLEAFDNSFHKWNA